MKIILEVDCTDSYPERKVALEISNEGFNVDGWLKISIDGREIGDIHIDELLPAIIGFDSRRSRNLTESG